MFRRVGSTRVEPLNVSDNKTGGSPPTTSRSSTTAASLISATRPSPDWKSLEEKDKKSQIDAVFKVQIDTTAKMDNSTLTKEMREQFNKTETDETYKKICKTLFKDIALDNDNKKIFKGKNLSLDGYSTLEEKFKDITQPKNQLCFLLACVQIKHNSKKGLTAADITALKQLKIVLESTKEDGLKSFESGLTSNEGEVKNSGNICLGFINHVLVSASTHFKREYTSSTSFSKTTKLSFGNHTLQFKTQTDKDSVGKVINTLGKATSPCGSPESAETVTFTEAKGKLTKMLTMKGDFNVGDKFQNALNELLEKIEKGGGNKLADAEMALYKKLLYLESYYNRHGAEVEELNGIPGADLKKLGLPQKLEGKDGFAGIADSYIGSRDVPFKALTNGLLTGDDRNTILNINDYISEALNGDYSGVFALKALAEADISAYDNNNINGEGTPTYQDVQKVIIAALNVSSEHDVLSRDGGATIKQNLSVNHMLDHYKKIHLASITWQLEQLDVSGVKTGKCEMTLQKDGTYTMAGQEFFVGRKLVSGVFQSGFHQKYSAGELGFLTREVAGEHGTSRDISDLDDLKQAIVVGNFAEFEKNTNINLSHISTACYGHALDEVLSSGIDGKFAETSKSLKDCYTEIQGQLTNLTKFFEADTTPDINVKEKFDQLFKAKLIHSKQYQDSSEIETHLSKITDATSDEGLSEAIKNYNQALNKLVGQRLFDDTDMDENVLSKLTLNTKDFNGNKVEIPVTQAEDLKEVASGDQAGKGIRNLGNSCYMNATIQMLKDHRPFRDKCKNSDDNAVLILFNDFFNAHDSGDSDGTETALRNLHGFLTMINDWGYDQQDAEELMRVILKQTGCVEMPEFQFSLKSTVSYTDGNDVEQKNPPKLEIATDLALPITGSETLDECLLKYQKEGDLPEYKIPDTNIVSSKATIKYEIAPKDVGGAMPANIQIQLKRFERNMAGRVTKKDLTSIEIKEVEIGGARYEPKSVVCHSGGTGGGHYINYTKKADGWYQFNDSIVSKVSNVDSMFENFKTSAYLIRMQKVEEDDGYFDEESFSDSDD